MYCSSRPKQPGFSFEALFPDELFPPGNKQKGKKYIVLLCFIEQCASGSKCQLIVRTTYYLYYTYMHMYECMLREEAGCRFSHDLEKWFR